MKEYLKRWDKVKKKKNRNNKNNIGYLKFVDFKNLPNEQLKKDLLIDLYPFFSKQQPTWWWPYGVSSYLVIFIISST